MESEPKNLLLVLIHIYIMLSIVHVNFNHSLPKRTGKVPSTNPSSFDDLHLLDSPTTTASLRNLEVVRGFAASSMAFTWAKETPGMMKAMKAFHTCDFAEYFRFLGIFNVFYTHHVSEIFADFCQVPIQDEGR